ncbi:MAG: adenylate/guanylate cyclase domain-containing protein [Acidimicrobiia bacterium]
MGSVVFRDGDYFGGTVNRAARISDVARPGEVLISKTTAETVRTSLGSAVQGVGEFSLKGVAKPLPLFSVGALPED